MLTSSLQSNGKKYVIAPLFLFSFCSFSNVLSSWCQYEALKYVNFPTQVRLPTSLASTLALLCFTRLSPPSSDALLSGSLEGMQAPSCHDHVDHPLWQEVHEA